MSDYSDHDYLAAALRSDLLLEFGAPPVRPHWCTECHGHDGPGSPCYVEPEEEPEEESDFCQGCNPEPTISELECGKCDSCGKELA